jgi:tetratricopeptide (TPR) repeat protein
MSPNVMQYHYLLGVALLRVGDRLNAVGALEAAEQLEPDRVLTLLALGIAHNSLQQYAEAKRVLTRAVELDSTNADSLAALGEAEQGLGELETAWKHVQQVLARAPQHATANLVAGLVAMDRSQYADARAALERAVQTDPLLFKAHYQLSLACGRLGDEAAASRYLEQYRQKLREVQKMIDELRMATGPAGTDSVRR